MASRRLRVIRMAGILATRFGLRLLIEPALGHAARCPALASYFPLPPVTFPPRTVPSAVRVLADRKVGKELSDEEAQRAADCGEIA